MFKQRTRRLAGIGVWVLLICLSVLIFRQIMQTPELPLIIYIPKDKDNYAPFWNVLEMGIMAAAKEKNAVVEVYSTDTDEQNIEAQNLMIKKAIEQKPDAIILGARSYEEQIELCREIVEQDIVLVTVDSDIGLEEKSCYVGTNNYDAGKAAGAALSDELSEDAKIALISFGKGASSALERERGFKDALSKGQQENLLGPYHCPPDNEEAYQFCREILEKNPDIEGVAGLAEPAISGIAKALMENKVGNNSIKAVGIDSSKTVIRALENGLIDTIIVQKPYNMGYFSLSNAIDALEGKKTEDFVDTGIQLIDKDNMYGPENQGLLFIFAEE